MTTVEMSTQNLKNLFHSQLDACAQEYYQALMEKYGDKIDSQELLDTLNRVRGTQDLDLTKKTKPAKKPKEPKEAKPAKTKEPKSPESLCQARTWGDGSGECRCSFGAGPNGLCAKHAKQELECAVPCSTTDNGHKRLGLYMGRINQWQDGVEGILPYKDQLGLLRIEWTSDHMKAIVEAALEDGSCKRPDTGLQSKRGRKPGSKKAAKVAELAAIVDMEETSPEPAADPETSPETHQTIMEELFGVDSDQEDVVPTKKETSHEEDEHYDQVARVEEKIYDDKTWVVDLDDQTIYFWDENDERHGANIGKWTEDGPDLDEEWKWMLDL